VRVAERYADGRAGEAERKAASAAVPCLHGNPDDVTDPEGIGAFGSEVAACAAFGADDYPPLPTYAVTCAIAAARAAANAASCAASTPLRAERPTAERVADRAYWDEQRVGAALVRDIFGAPFRPLPPAVLAWNGGTVHRLAQAAYDERILPSGALDPGRLGILADALLDAGCDGEEIVPHLRQQGAVHVRGCWVLDLLLGKE
jgi:hypothetical protein